MNVRPYTTPLKTASVSFRAVGVWRAVVTEVLGTQVKVVVPRLSGELEYGPIDMAAPNETTPAAIGDPVLVGFVEGRQDELVVIGSLRTSLPVDTDPFNDFASVEYTASSTAAGQVLDTVSASVYRSVKYVVQATTTSSYRVSELLVIHDGTAVSFVEYGNIVIGVDPVAAYDSDLSSGSLVLKVTPTVSPVTFRVSRAAIPV